MEKNTVILSSRVRLARNLVDYPFPPVLDATGRKEIIEKVAAAAEAGGYVRDEKISDPIYANALCEAHKISREFAAETEAHALFVNEKEGTSVMVCEEDHLRLQSFADGADIDLALDRVLAAETFFSSRLRFAFDKDLGYLTHCPTNLGTAMRASVLAFLPALTLSDRMPALKTELNKIGMTLRGMYGEGSEPGAFLYQISNQQSLGLSETELCRKVSAVTKQIAAEEESMRQSLSDASRDRLTDKILRSLGTLRYAHLLQSREFLECYAYVRLGITLGVLPALSLSDLDALLPKVGPAHIALRAPETANDPAARDKYRAAYVREAFPQN